MYFILIWIPGTYLCFRCESWISHVSHVSHVNVVYLIIIYVCYVFAYYEIFYALKRYITIKGK